MKTSEAVCEITSLQINMMTTQSTKNAMERMDMNDRLGRKRKHDGPEAISFKWGLFHFWKRPPTAVKAPFGGWSARCSPHYIPEQDGVKEVVCKRECNLRHPNDEEFVIRRLKMWCLGYCCCANKAKHYSYMRDYPADDHLLTNEATHLL